MKAVGGIPVRTTIYTTLAPRGAGLDDTSRIQEAINKCPDGQVVQLSVGTFLVNGGNYLLLNKGITFRGAGPGRTILAKTDGAKPLKQAVGPDPAPLIIVGPHRYPGTQDPGGIVASTNLTADAVKGEYDVQVTSAAGFFPGQIVLLDETSGAGWQIDPQRRGRIWASPDWRVIWQKHDPPVPDIDDFAPADYPITPGTAGSWFARPDRPTSEIKQIASVSGSIIKFTTPIHISYRSSHAAQLSYHKEPYVQYAGVEDLTLTGGEVGNLRFAWAAHCWAKNLESTVWHDEGFAIDQCFRIELREFYVHDTAWPEPGGGGYAISLSSGTSEMLIENGIAVKANKLLVARSAGAGSVVAYNYLDMAYMNSNPAWIEVGLNASHMVGPHHVLFEGNYAHNADSDQTHGNSIYNTYFRNHLRGVRAPFATPARVKIDDNARLNNGPKRCAGLMAYSYWMSFIGNVLGSPGQMQGWTYETNFARGGPGIWMLGWDNYKPYPTDAQVSATTLRHGNFDYVTNSVKWSAAIADRTMPKSLYLRDRPAFFDAGRGYTWPWVDPVGTTKLYTLPAKARYDAGTPFVQP